MAKAMINKMILLSKHTKVIFVSVLVLSCAHTNKLPIKEIRLPQTDDRLNIPIELIITEELQNAKLYYYPLGENLVYQTERMMNNIFMDVRVNYNSNINLGNNTDRYLMIPKLVYCGRARGASFTPEEGTSIIMQWKIAKHNKEPIWVETITGRFVGTYEGSSVENFVQQTFYRALTDLFQKSQEEILSSNLLKSLQSEEPQTVNSKQSLVSADIEGGNKTEKSTLALKPTSDQLKLAILPFHINTKGLQYVSSVEETAINALSQALISNRILFVTHSYYDIGNEKNFKAINKSIIPSGNLGDLWIKNIFSPQKPNIDLLSEIGKELGVDVVLIGSISARGGSAIDVEYYLINLETLETFCTKDKIDTREYRNLIYSLTKLYIDSYPSSVK